MRPHPVLTPLSWVYGATISTRNLMYDAGIIRTAEIPVPVISVGNITAGGTGKTPVVDALLKLFSPRGRKLAMLSRGYGRKSTGFIEVSDGNSITAEVQSAGDEPMMIAHRNPGVLVAVDEDRVHGARLLTEKYHAEILVLDDAFQHRAIDRNLDIVLVDSTEALFETSLLPAGYRREPLTALRRADILVITRVDNVASVVELRGRLRHYTSAEILTTSFSVSSFKRGKSHFSMNLQSLKGKRAVAFCGIARPEGFRATLQQCGVDVAELHVFDDHHWYTAQDLQLISRSIALHHVDYVMTTEKDFIRIPRREFASFIDGEPLFYPEMRVDFHQADIWKDRVFQSIDQDQRTQ